MGFQGFGVWGFRGFRVLGLWGLVIWVWALGFEGLGFSSPCAARGPGQGFGDFGMNLNLYDLVFCSVPSSLWIPQGGTE